MTQAQTLAKLLVRKRGVTPLEIIQIVGTVCPHRRLSDLKEQGWTITRQQVNGKDFGRYFGTPPRSQS